MSTTWTLDQMAAGIDPRKAPATICKPPLTHVRMDDEHFAESARAALEKAAEWMEQGFTVRAYESQSGDDEDYRWVVERYVDADSAGYVRNPLRRDQDRLDSL